MTSLSRRSLLRTVGVAGVSGIVGCSSSSSIVPPPEPRVELPAATFDPERLVIDPGETVTWWNSDSNKHTVTAYGGRIPDDADYFTSGGFDSATAARGPDLKNGLLEQGDRFEHRFTVPGHYRYYCIPHEQWYTMIGTIVVRTEAGEIPSPPEVVEPDTDHVVGMSENAYHPASLEIQVGESVGWVNGTGIAHSVTGENGGEDIPDGDDREFPEEGEYFASGGFDSTAAAVDDWTSARKGDILPEEPFVHTFETPGTYPYLCLLHDLNMRGTVTVRST